MSCINYYCSSVLINKNEQEGLVKIYNNSSNLYIVVIPIIYNSMKFVTKTTIMLQKQTKAKMIFALLFIPVLLTAATLTSNTSYNRAFAQSSDLICSDAVFTPSLPQSFTNGTSIPFSVDF